MRVLLHMCHILHRKIVMGNLRPAIMHTIQTIYMIYSTYNSSTRALIYATRGLHQVHSQAHVYSMGYLHHPLIQVILRPTFLTTLRP